jgi:hypothetical protein
MEEMKLVDIEFKKHDPSKVVSNHLASCGLKRYEHEDSLHDEIFRGARSFAEVLSRIQAFPPGDMAEFLKFREHRQSCLPQILPGEAPELPVTKQMGAKSAKDSSPSGEKDQGKTREAGTSELGAKVPQKQEGNPEKGAPNESATEVTPKQTSKQIGSLIAIVTPLQFIKGNPNEGWIFNEELTPISIEELPPNKFFFD